MDFWSIKKTDLIDVCKTLKFSLPNYILGIDVNPTGIGYCLLGFNTYKFKSINEVDILQSGVLIKKFLDTNNENPNESRQSYRSLRRRYQRIVAKKNRLFNFVKNVFSRYDKNDFGLYDKNDEDFKKYYESIAKKSKVYRGKYHKKSIQIVKCKECSKKDNSDCIIKEEFKECKECKQKLVHTIYEPPFYKESLLDLYIKGTKEKVSLMDLYILIRYIFNKGLGYESIVDFMLGKQTTISGTPDEDANGDVEKTINELNGLINTLDIEKYPKNLLGLKKYMLDKLRDSSITDDEFKLYLTKVYKSKSMIVKVLNDLLDEQSKHHENLFNQTFTSNDIDSYIPNYSKTDNNMTFIEVVNAIMFYRRPLKSCEHLRGICPLELSKRRAMNSTLASECNALIRLNNIKIINKSDNSIVNLEEADIHKLYEYNKYNSINSSDIVIDLLKEKLAKLVNIDLYTHSTTKVGKSTKKSKSDKQIKNELLSHFSTNISDNFKIVKAKEVDDSAYSEEALNKLLPNLRLGIDEYNSKIKAGYTISNPNSLDNNIIIGGEFYRKNLSSKLTVKQKHLFTKVEYNESNEGILKYLGTSTRDITSPSVRKVVYLGVNLIKNLIWKYGYIDEIYIETVRELRQSKKIRDVRKKFNKTNENLNKLIKDYLGSNQLNVSINNIKKVKLLLKLPYKDNGILKPSNSFINKSNFSTEINRTRICLYDGSEITFTNLFSTNSNIEVEHIIPRSRGGVDKPYNLTLCTQSINQIKSNIYALDYIEQNNPSFVNNYKDLVKLMPKPTQECLLMKVENVTQDFAESALNVTGHIAITLSNIFQNLCNKVYNTNGVLTAYLREKAGQKFNGILALGINKDKKNRYDLRHHGLDACIIALQGCNLPNSTYTYRNQMIAHIKNRNSTQISNFALSNAVYDKVKVAMSKCVVIPLDKTRLLKSKKNHYVYSKSNKKKAQKTYVPNARLHAETFYPKDKKSTTMIDVIHKGLYSKTNPKNAITIVQPSNNYAAVFYTIDKKIKVKIFTFYEAVNNKLINKRINNNNNFFKGEDLFKNDLEKTLKVSKKIAKYPNEKCIEKIDFNKDNIKAVLRKNDTILVYNEVDLIPYNNNINNANKDREFILNHLYIVKKMSGNKVQVAKAHINSKDTTDFKSDYWKDLSEQVKKVSPNTTIDIKSTLFSIVDVNNDIISIENKVHDYRYLDILTDFKKLHWVPFNISIVELLRLK